MPAKKPVRPAAKKPATKAAAPRAAASTGQDIDTDVLIIGGGLAGFTTAVGLKDAGLRVTLVEKSDEFGGRARSWTDPVTGDPVHIGPHIFLNKYPNMFRLMEQLGTMDLVDWQDEGHFITVVHGQMEVPMKSNQRLPAPFHFTRSLINDKTTPPAHALSQLPVTAYALSLTEKELLHLDNINASAFLRSMGVSEFMIQHFWGFACMAIMNVPVELCSAGALLRFYAGLVGMSSMRIGFPAAGLSDLYVPQSLRIMDAAGMQVIQGVGVREITGDETKATGALLEDGRRIRAKTVVAALTPQALRLVSRREWIKNYKVFHDLVYFQASPYVSTYLWFDRKLTDKKFWARAYDLNDLNCDFYDLSNINKGWEGRNSLITTNCIYCERAAHMSDEEIIAETVRELSEYLPEAATAKVEHAVVNRIPMAIHCPYPGMEQRRAPTITPVKNLVLAGDWLATGLPSCMENACLTGWQAAEAVLGMHSRPVPQFSIPFGVGNLEGAAGLWNRIGRAIPLDPISGLLRSRRNTRAPWVA